MVENENTFNLPAASSMKSFPGAEDGGALLHRLMRDSWLRCCHKTLLLHSHMQTKVWEKRPLSLSRKALESLFENEQIFGLNYAGNRKAIS